MSIELPPLLPAVDEEPDEWGPDHDELVGEVLDQATVEALIEEGIRQGAIEPSPLPKATQTSRGDRRKWLGDE